MPIASHDHDVTVIGAGPAGCACARLLASWGHRVLVLTRPVNRGRGLVESIPPSARKLLAAVDLLGAVESAGFAPNRGNTVWWGSSEGRQENFAASSSDAGFQVFRPDLDHLLRAHAEAAGAALRIASIRAVHLDDDRCAAVEYTTGSDHHVARSPFVVDASGRSGVIARRGLRRYEPNHRMQAYLGVWRHPDGWAGDEGRTLVETYEDGWAWSLAVSPTNRQVAVMVDAATTRTARGPTIDHAYAAEIAKTRQIRTITRGAALERVWACDASLYSAARFAGPGFLLVGDAGATLDPLSSFGVKKALASGWLAAVALHTALVDTSRQALALDFFSTREREVYVADLARTREYARRANEHHRHHFWAARSGGAVPADRDNRPSLASPDVRAAHARLRATPSVELRRGRPAPALQPVIRGHEVVLEEALALQAGAVRFAAGVDLPLLVRLATHSSRVPDLYEAYCRARGGTELPPFLAALSLLLSERILVAQPPGLA